MSITKEVYYDKYCNKCKHWKLKESEDPCDECLAQGFNFESHKPIYFEEGSSVKATKKGRN